MPLKKWKVNDNIEEAEKNKSAGALISTCARQRKVKKRGGKNMIVLKSSREIEKMKDAGKILAACHKEIAKLIKPGITTWEIDQFVEGFLKKNNATPEQKGYKGYEYATCASINDEICHGFPRKVPLKEGDIVTVDMVVRYNGALADSAWSYAIGNITEENEHLLKVTKEALYKGIEAAGSRQPNRRHWPCHSAICGKRGLVCCPRFHWSRNRYSDTRETGCTTLWTSWKRAKD